MDGNAKTSQAQTEEGLVAPTYKYISLSLSPRYRSNISLQSKRLSLYQSHIGPLLQGGHAYRCFCSAERLDNLNQARNDKGLPLGYDRKCLDISIPEAERRAAGGELHVIRFRASDQGYPEYKDLVYGKVQRPRMQGFDVYDDPILIKSDGFPTYHYANVVDDHLMKISHVIRGAVSFLHHCRVDLRGNIENPFLRQEWISSTPFHIALYNAFQWDPPAFAHVGLLQDENRQKLSKRNHDLDIQSFERNGVLPHTMVNFAALLGWSHNRKSDVMNLQELTDLVCLFIPVNVYSTQFRANSHKV